MPNGEQPVTLNDEPSDANENEIDYITTRDSLDDVNVVAKSRSERKSNDVIKRIEATEYVRIEIENLDRPDSTTYPEIAGFVKGQKKGANVTEENSSKASDAKHAPIMGMILSCPKYPKMTIELKI